MPLMRLALRALLVAALVVPQLALAQVAPSPAVEKTERVAATTTVILVRHAEKEAEPANDPPLNAAGVARAKALVQVVRDAGVQAIVTTQYQRTRLTAQPAAEALGIQPEIVEARGGSHAQEVARYVLGRHAGRTVLVVGHSNTIPAIAAALGAPHPGVIDDADYTNLFVVVVGPDGKGRLVRAKF